MTTEHPWFQRSRIEVPVPRKLRNRLAPPAGLPTTSVLESQPCPAFSEAGSDSVTPQRSRHHRSHLWCSALSWNGHRQSGGHWNAALGLPGTRIDLTGFSAASWRCAGGRGALSGSGVRGVNGSLVVMSKHRPQRRYGAAPLEEQTTKSHGSSIVFTTVAGSWNVHKFTDVEK